MEKKKETKKPTQKQEIIRYLREEGSITAFDAVMNLGILQLSARLVELEEMGWEFTRKLVTKNNRYGRKVFFYCYSIKRRGQMP